MLCTRAARLCMGVCVCVNRQRRNVREKSFEMEPVGVLGELKKGASRNGIAREGLN